MSTTITRPKYDGARFYSTSDLSLGLNLLKAEDSIHRFASKTDSFSINEILEMYNILMLMDTEIIHDSWTPDNYSNLKKYANTYKSIIGKYTSEFDYASFLEIYSSICLSYISSFWDIFETYKMYDNCPESIFKSLITSDSSTLHHILRHRKIVNRFDIILSDFMMENRFGAELLISEFLVRNNEKSRGYYFPKSLSRASMKALIVSYINSQNPNPNYLDVIVKGKQCKEIDLDDNTRLLAKRKHSEFWNDFFKHNTGFSLGTSVAFIDVDNPVSANLDDPLNPSFTFSSRWISNNLDFPTLMNNFIHLFGFVDTCYRSTFPLKTSQQHSIESFIGLKSKRAYPVDTAYEMLESISTVIIAAYDLELAKHSIRIEDLIVWFFEEYLETEFNAKGFYYNESSCNSTHLEKCRHLCSELDSILKQFKTYVENGCIDRELIEMSSHTPLFSQVNSFNKQKYAYLQDSALINMSYAFFSNQSTLSFTEITQSKYDTFFDLLCSENMHYDDFYDYQKPTIDILIGNDLLSYDTNKHLRLNKGKIFLLRDFYLNEVLCSTYYHSSDYFNDLSSNNKISFEGTLFSRLEQDYLDYMLNDHKFDNGPQLRNIYIHGSNSLDIKKHEHDYYKLLKIMVLIILKINEEFCRRDDTWSIQE